MTNLLGWLEAFGLVSGVARSAPVYAVVSAAHIAGIALLAGPVLLVDLRLAGWLRAGWPGATGVNSTVKSAYPRRMYTLPCGLA